MTPLLCSSLLGPFLVLGLAPAPAPMPETVIIPARQHSKDNAQAVAFSPDGKRVAAAFGGPSNGRFPLEPRGGGVAVWDTATGKLLAWAGEYGDIIRLEFSPDGKSLLYGRVYTPGDSIDDDVVVVLDPETGKSRKRWSGSATFAVQPRGGLVLVGSGECQTFDLDKFQPQGRLPVPVRCLAASLDGSTLAAIHIVKEPLTRGGQVVPGVFSMIPKGLGLFDLAGLKQKDRTEYDQLRSCFGLALAPDGKLLATGHPLGIVRVWDTAKLAEPRKLEVGGKSQALPRFSPDGKTLTVLTQPANATRWNYNPKDPSGFDLKRQQADAGCDLIFHDVATLQPVRRWRFEDGRFGTWYARSGNSDLYPEHNPARLAFSPDGKHVLVGCNGVVLVESATGKVVRQFEPKPAEVGK